MSPMGRPEGECRSAEREGNPASTMGHPEGALQSAPIAWPLTIYYDDSCALCRTEIGTLMARTPPGRLALIDCSPPTFSDDACAAAGVTREALMARIHARDARGHWLRGLDVFAAVYRAAGLVPLARLYENRRLRPWLDRLYAWVADHRQLLSRLGLARAFRLVAPAARAGRGCRTGACVLPAGRGDCR